MEYLNQAQIVEKLNITERQLIRWIKSGLPHKINPEDKNFMFDYDEIISWIDVGELAKHKPDYCGQKDGDCRICNSYNFDCHNYPVLRDEEII